MPPQRLITHLRHVDLAVPDYQTQLDFYTNAWGLKAEHSDSGLTFLAESAKGRRNRVGSVLISRDRAHAAGSGSGDKVPA